MAYTVNTKINLHPVLPVAEANMLTVLTFVDSKSNYSTSQLQYVPDRRTFETYFNDHYVNYSQSLRQAQTVLGYDYNILAYNVRKCKHPETVRIFQDSSGDFQSYWFDPELDIKPIHTVLHGTEHLAVKFRPDELIEGHYLLLEHTINGVAANCYIGTYETADNGKHPLISSLNYANNAAMEYVYDPEDPQGSIETLIRKLSTEESYSCAYTSDGYMHIMYPYAFNTGNFNEDSDERRVVAVDDPVFLAQYLSNTSYNSRIMDIYSKYNSELEDLAVEFSYQTQTYYAAVYRYQNGNNIIDAENFSASDIDSLYSKINFLSKYVRIDPKSTVFPLGTFRLRQMHEGETVTLDDYLDAIDSLKEYVDEEYDFNANIILEPDLGLSKEDALKIQTHISNTFYDINNMCVKFFNYLGQVDNNLTCYFDNSLFLYRTDIVNTKMLILKMLISGSRTIHLNDIVRIQDNNEGELPYFVNVPRIGFEYVLFQRIKTLLWNRLYYVYDMLVVSCVNSQSNSSPAVKNRFYFYDLIEMLTTYFTKHFGYDPDMYIKSYDEDLSQNKAHVVVAYNTSDLSEVKTIDLLLDLYGSAEQMEN